MIHSEVTTGPTHAIGFAQGHQGPGVSEAWFKLMEAIPELKEVFALGDKVLVAGRSVAIETRDSGAEELSDQELGNPFRLVKS